MNGISNPARSSKSGLSQGSPLRIVVPIQEPLSSTSRSMIEMDRVTKVFKSKQKNGVAAVSELCFTINQNSATLVTGASGSGKTTFLSLIGCMVRPTAGRIAVDGKDVSRLPEEMLTEVRRNTFGFVFQHSLLINGLSAVSNVMLPALPRPEIGTELRVKAYSLLERFGLAGRARDRVECLSGGEQQRVAIARALINDPLVVLADEPTAHLGSGDTQSVLDLFSELRSEGRTVVVASHDQALIRSGYFDQTMVLKDGRLISERR